MDKMTLKTNVYIDAFNLYYGCLRNSPFRWLDIVALAQVSLPNDTINQVKYFTARIKARPNNPDKPLRQQAYLRAISTLPQVQIIEGAFLTQKVMMPLVSPLPDGTTKIEVWKTEEKGSDVNIATHLLNDGHKGDYELAVVISNDSDLVEPIRMVIQELGLPVGVLNPHISKNSNPSVQLRNTANFFRYLRKSDLRTCQLPTSLEDAQGKIYKPKEW